MPNVSTPESLEALNTLLQVRADGCNPSTLWSVGYDQIMHGEIQTALLGQKSPEQARSDAQARLVDIASFQ